MVSVSQGRGPKQRSHTASKLKQGPSLGTSKEARRQTRDEHLQTVPGLQDHGLREGREAGSPLTPGPQRCYQPDPAENPSRIPVHSSLSPLVLQLPTARTLFMAAPFSSRCLQAPKASGLDRRLGVGGNCSPPSPPLNPAGRRKQGAGLGACRLHTELEGQDPPGRAT